MSGVAGDFRLQTGENLSGGRLEQGEEIGGGRAEFGGEIGVEGVEIFHVDEEGVRVVEEAFTVREDIVASLEVTDELFEFEEERVVGSVGFSLPRVRLVTVEYASLVPP